MFSLKDKVAVVTGAASGIGRATALRFAAAGARLVLADLQDASELAGETGGLFVRTDVAREEQVGALMEAAVATYGRLDIVINNVGIGLGNELQELPEQEFDRIMGINVKGVLWGIKRAAPRMADGGVIINTSSYAGQFGFPTYGAYAASKHAVVGLSRTAALELAPRGIRVNAVCPGTIDTPMNEGPTAETEILLARHLAPLGRMGLTEEVAALFHFLASDDSAFITGAVIPIDGGMSAGIGLGIIEPLLAGAGGQIDAAAGDGSMED